MSTPRDARAEARDGRRNHLQPPQNGLGRADRIRSRSVSPSTPGTFQFPPLPLSPKQSSSEVENEQFRDALTYTGNMTSLSVDDIVRIATASAQAAAREMAAATSIAVSTHAASSNTVKKVELPSFDKSNIHTWIRRVEAAFGRAGVTLAKDKFFFIEAKIDVHLNPKVNEFLCGESTEEKWDEFLEYLQNEYGHSREQQASLFLRGIPREGLRPTQHLAKIRDLTKDVTLDDLIKEMVLRDLPTTIRQSLAERTDLSAEDAAKAADHYFDKEGRPKHQATNTEVNSLTDNLNSLDVGEEQEDENGQVNAVQRGRFRNNNHYRGRNPLGRPQQQQQQHRKPNPSTWHSQPKPNSRSTTVEPSKTSLKQICRFHLNYGEKAVSCEPGCQFRAKPQQSSHQTGNGAAGRRM